MTISGKDEGLSQGPVAENRTLNDRAQNSRAGDENKPEIRYGTPLESRSQVGRTSIDESGLSQTTSSPHGRRESYGRSNINYDASREARSIPAASHDARTYSSPFAGHGAAARAYVAPGTVTTSSNESDSRLNMNYSPTTYSPFATTYNTQSYSSSIPSYGPGTDVGHTTPSTAYNIYPTVQARSPAVEHPNPVQSRPSAPDIPQTTVSSAKRPIYAARGQEVAPGEDDTSGKIKVKFWLPSAGIDPKALSLFVKFCVDPNSRIGKLVKDKKDGFLIEASRTLTKGEVEDIRDDSESWKRECERGNGGGLYQDSETARRRRARTGRR
jgi:hypothetical protein